MLMEIHPNLDTILYSLIRKYLTKFEAERESRKVSLMQGMLLAVFRKNLI